MEVDRWVWMWGRSTFSALLVDTWDDGNRWTKTLKFNWMCWEHTGEDGSWIGFASWKICMLEVLHFSFGEVPGDKGSILVCMFDELYEWEVMVPRCQNIARYVVYRPMKTVHHEDVWGERYGRTSRSLCEGVEFSKNFLSAGNKLVRVIFCCSGWRAWRRIEGVRSAWNIAVCKLKACQIGTWFGVLSGEYQ